MVLRLIAAVIILTLVSGNDELLEELLDATTIANCVIGDNEENEQDTLDLDFEGYKSHEIHSSVKFENAYCNFELATDD